jgi:hypothetical protein
MTNRISRSAKLLFTSALLALSIGACAADPDLEPTSADDSALMSTQAQGDEAARTEAAGPANLAASCCSSGGYWCPTNANVEYDYDPPGCGAFTKPRAASLCNSRCSTACRDSGWIDSCN